MSRPTARADGEDLRAVRVQDGSVSHDGESYGTSGGTWAMVDSKDMAHFLIEWGEPWERTSVGLIPPVPLSELRSR